ncbi:MAG: hypothetical protein K0R55_4192 [Sporomusa sp.]|nr:hypothetical protein [Sporomusa sp.]
MALSIAAYGGLRPPPNGGLEGLPPSLVMHNACFRSSNHHFHGARQVNNPKQIY